MFKFAFRKFSDSSRATRRAIFRASFSFEKTTRLLDLGSEDGNNIASIIDGLDLRADNVFISDIDGPVLERGRSKYGFVPVLLKEGGELPFDKGYFDVVFCSSVIEHVTVPKDEIWNVRSSRVFRERAVESQKTFASEIARVGRQYFVQTPNRRFPVESHSWLPMLGMLPREMQIPTISIANRVWVKKTIPDFHLLSPVDMKKLFPAARILLEKKFGFTKSIMAIKSDRQGKTEEPFGDKGSKG